MAGKGSIKKTTKPPNGKKASSNTKSSGGRGAAAAAATKKTTTSSTNSGANQRRRAPKSKNPLDKIPEFVPVPGADTEDVDISDEDLAFFAENEGFGEFLTSLDSKALSKNLTRDQLPKAERPKKQGSAEDGGEEASSESDEEDYDHEIDMDADTDTDTDAEEDTVEDAELSASDDDEVMEDAAESQPVNEEERDAIRAMMSNKNKRAVSKKRKHQDDSDDEVMDYELKPRKVGEEWTRKDFVERLPIKLASGKIQPVERDEGAAEKQLAENKDEQEDNKPTVADDKVTEERPKEEKKEEEPKLSKKEYLLKKKEDLALVAMSIQEDPEENIKHLKTLRRLTGDENPIIKKLGLLTQLAVYKDIIPGYRIRALTEQEEAVKVSKEVKKVREFEKTLLGSYEMYLKDLDNLLKKKTAQEDPSIALVATKCVCELLTTKTHFNFRLNLMMTVVTRLSTLEWNEMSELCSKAIVEVFENDESGRVSLDAVTMMTRMIKSKHYQVHENVINTFLHLRLKDELMPELSKESGSSDAKSKKQKKQFLNKKARKALKETKEIEKEFKEAEEVVDKEEKERTHTETLKLIFAFYFRILKKQSTSPLLPAVLQGLGKFAHLISVDFFDDLLGALKVVLDSLDHNTSKGTAGAGTRKRLLCIITAFELLSGQGEAFVTYDLKEYYSALYEILFEASFHYNIEHRINPEFASEAEMIVRGLEQMFIKKRQVPIDRMAAFIKRFSIVALNMPTKTVTNCLQMVKRLITRDNRLDALVQSEDRAASGVYMPYLQDPDLCNPFGTSLYELFLYKDHYDPHIRTLAQSILQPPEAP